MRGTVLAELQSISPADDIERGHLNDAIAWVRSGAPIFRTVRPATPPKHLVSYFAVVDEDEILLVDHKNAQLWLPSGGHVEPDENPRKTVVRELKEELGIELDQGVIGPPLMVTCTPTVGLVAGHTDVSLWYVIQADRTAPVSYDDKEFNAVGWFKFDQVPLQRSDPHLGRFLAKLRAGSRA